MNDESNRRVIITTQWPIHFDYFLLLLFKTDFLIFVGHFVYVRLNENINIFNVSLHLIRQDLTNESLKCRSLNSKHGRWLPLDAIEVKCIVQFELSMFENYFVWSSGTS